MPDLDLISPFKILNNSDTCCQFEEASHEQKHNEAIDFSLTCTRDRIDSEDFILPISMQCSKEWDFAFQELSALKPNGGEDALPRRKSSVILAADPTLNQLEVCL